MLDDRPSERDVLRVVYRVHALVRLAYVAVQPEPLLEIVVLVVERGTAVGALFQVHLGLLLAGNDLHAVLQQLLNVRQLLLTLHQDVVHLCLNILLNLVNRELERLRLREELNDRGLLPLVVNHAVDVKVKLFLDVPDDRGEILPNVLVILHLARVVRLLCEVHLLFRQSEGRPKTVYYKVVCLVMRHEVVA